MATTNVNSGGWRIRTSAGQAPSALAVRCNRPLCQPSVTRRQRRVGDSNPQGGEATPVFKTGALPIQPTLRQLDPSDDDVLIAVSPATIGHPINSGHRRGLNPHLPGASRASSRWTTGPIQEFGVLSQAFRVGKGWTLWPSPPNSRLPTVNSRLTHASGRIRTCTEPVLSRLPLPLGY